jgi:hypothetical protein
MSWTVERHTLLLFRIDLLLGRHDDCVRRVVMRYKKAREIKMTMRGGCSLVFGAGHYGLSKHFSAREK